MEYYSYVLLKFVMGFIIIMTHLNLSGKTQLSQLTPIDFIGNFVLGGIIGGVIYSDSIPMYQYIIVLLIGVMLISFLNFMTKHVSFIRTVTIGDPIPIIKKGRFLMDNIMQSKNKVDILNVTSQLHAQGIHSFQVVVYAQIEPGGQLTVICDEASMPSVIIIKDGSIRHHSLIGIEKDEEWLREELDKHDINEKDIFLAEFWAGKVIFIMKDGSVIK